MRSAAFAIALALLGFAPAHAAECVVLVHGLGRSPASMSPMGASLARKGYVIVNRGYPSRSQSVEASSAVIGQDIADCRARRAEPINFVTHSLGGIVLSQYFQNHHVPDAGRVVMLAPPNHGSEIVDHLHGRWWFERALGPAAQQLATGKAGVFNRLQPIPLQIGVIAGTRSHEPWFASYFHSPNDGKVSVESAKLAGMTDFLTVDASHTYIMESTEVQDQAATFIATGRFRHR